MTPKRKTGTCLKCCATKEIVAKGFCGNCYRYLRIRENAHALYKKRMSSLRYNRKLSGIPLDAPIKETNNQKIIKNTEAWAIQYLWDRGYEIRKIEKNEEILK